MDRQYYRSSLSTAAALPLTPLIDMVFLIVVIAQALITTAAGLAVAIPSALFHHLFVTHVQRTVARLNIAVSELTAYFAARG